MGRVLVVDDDRDCAEELAELLGYFGFDALSANSLAAARQSISERPADALVIDVIMDGESGIDLALECLAADHPPRVVLLSGRDLTQAECSRFSGVAPQLLLKPADAEQLVSLLNS